MRSLASRAACLAALASTLWAAWLCRSRWTGDPVDRALRQAELDPDHEVQHWRHALRLRPRTPQALLGLALAAESAGRWDEARSLLDRAAAIDRTFRPVWARLNFLARRDDAAAFWPAARHAFAMSHRDRQALFALCWRVRHDGAWLLREVTGRRAPVLFDATQFFLSRDLPAARLAYALLLEQPYLPLGAANAGRVATREERRALGLDLCDLDLDQRQLSAAWSTWQQMRRHGLLGSASGRGFDWRPVAGSGVEATPAGPQWVLVFDGEQKEGTAVLWRPAPPLPATSPGAPRLPAPLQALRQADGWRIPAPAAGFRGVLTVEGEAP